MDELTKFELDELWMVHTRAAYEHIGALAMQLEVIPFLTPQGYENSREKLAELKKAARLASRNWFLAHLKFYHMDETTFMHANPQYAQILCLSELPETPQPPPEPLPWDNLNPMLSPT